MDFIYERTRTPSGVKIETVTGGNHYKGKVWREIARQIYCENGKDDFRDIGHFSSGAPFIYGAAERISISHTEGCFAVATVPASPDADLSSFAPECAVGVDVESADRRKVMDVRGRFLSDAETVLVPSDSVKANVIAWTCKEAMLKAALDPSVDWRENIVITRLPAPGSPGRGYVVLKGERKEFLLETIETEGFFITIASCRELS